MLSQQERQDKEGFLGQQVSLKGKINQNFDRASQDFEEVVSALQAHQENSNNDSSLSSVDRYGHIQYRCAAIATTNPKVAMAHKSHKAGDVDLRSVWLLGYQSTFDLCCNPDFANKRHNAKRAIYMSYN
jgi:hypothetical protein